MAKHKIVAIHMSQASGGLGVENRYSLRAGKDKVEFEDLGGEVLVTLRPPRSLPQQKAVVMVMKVPKSQIRYMEVEEVEGAK